MKSKFRLFSMLSIAMLGIVFATGQVHAQRAQDDDNPDKTKTKKAEAVSKKVYDRIQEAQLKIDDGDEQGALKILQGLEKSGKLSNYELTNVLNYEGFVYYSLERIPEAIAVYRRLIAIPELEPQLKKQTVYTLAQLMTMEENYTEALKLMDLWFTLETNPAPQPYILYAQNLYQTNQYLAMIEPIETAIGIAEKRNMEPKEDWYVLLNFAYFQDENYEMVKDVQKILLVKWPKKRYWFSLAGAYTELGEDANLIAAYDAAHTQGMLEKENELVTMAQLYMQAEVPYKAAVLLDKEMQSGRVSKDAKNYRLLSQALSLSMEDEKAIPALKEAARLTDEGELDLRLGNAYLNIGNYGQCVASVESAIRKGNVKSPDNAQISLGMCLYNEKKYRDAIRAFREAGKTPRSRRVANQWITVIESDIERNEQIRLAETAARKRQQDLAKRRQASGRI